MKKEIINCNKNSDFMDKTARLLKKNLVGKVIADIRFMEKDEVEANAWSESGVVIELSDGEIIYPLSDEEGNSPGTLGSSIKGIEVSPPIRLPKDDDSECRKTFAKVINMI